MKNNFKNVIKPDKNSKLLVEITNICNTLILSVSNFNKRLTNIENTKTFDFNSSHTSYYLQPSLAGTGTQNEVQIFVDGKVIPISVIPYDLSTVQWRTNYITSFTYREDIKQTQILFIASDPSTVVNCVSIPIEI